MMKSRVSECHPDIKHEAKGLCIKCYGKLHAKTAKRKEYMNIYNKTKRDKNSKNAYMKNYYQKPEVKLHRKKYSNNYTKSRRANNPLERIKHTIRTRVVATLKIARFKKKSKFSEYLGCSVEQLKSHLESQFTSNMSWNNYGMNGWHVDHIIPLSNAETEESLYKLFHYTNLQPLWAYDNLSKGDKYEAQ